MNLPGRIAGTRSADRSSGLSLQLAMVVGAWLLFIGLASHFLASWANAALGLSLPVIGRAWFTLLFTGFALLHGITRIGFARTLAFLAVCAAVTWSFEEVGILTGAIYGRYHYSDLLGPKLGDVPLLIPFAWFMMVYASWVVASLLLEGLTYGAWVTPVLRVGIATLAMTSWDTLMDPGMARAGVWTWEDGGDYFGVPLQNFVGWLVTTATVYTLAELVISRQRAPADVSGGTHAGLPAVLYGLIALDRLLLPDIPALRVSAGFGMCVLALLACLRAFAPDPPPRRPDPRAR